MALTKLGNEQGYLKAGFLGYQKSGKSFTAVLLAIGTRKFFNLQGPIAFYDTESGSGYVAEMVKKETGTDLLGCRSRSFKSLMQFTQDCMEAKVSVAIVDSITHPWRELCDSYLLQLNEARKSKGWNPLQKLEFQHWSAIKGLWQPWSDFYLNSPLHIVVCGRAGVIWEMEKNAETNRTELIQAGTKMKTESEFGFEPSLLVEMEREQVPDGKGGFKITHQATVIGDRFNEMDGLTCANPSFAFFEPHVKRLRPGAHATVDTRSQTATGADEMGQGDFERERKLRTIYCEEIQGEIVSKYPGQSSDEKRLKADLMQKFFGTRSWTKIESLDSVALKSGLDALRREFGIETEDEDDGGLGPTNGENAPTGALVQSLRLLMKPDKVVESRFLAMCGELGTARAGLETLEQAEEAELTRILEGWASHIKAYKESQG